MIHPLRTPLRLLALIAAAGAAAMLMNRPASGDDIDLLRFSSGKPYVFILLDSSSSMNLAPDGTWLRAGGDDHRSRLHSAKKVLHEVFSEVSDVHYGFATFNQDALKVRAKHWLYYTRDATPSAAEFPLAYPLSQGTEPTDEEVCENAAGATVPCTNPGAVIVDLLPNFVGDFLTFGPRLDVPASTACTPIPFGNAGSDDREKLNHYPKFGFPSQTSATTTLWLDTGGNDEPDYRLVLSIASGMVGDPSLNVKMVLHEVDVFDEDACDATFVPGSRERASVRFERYQEFLVWDAPSGTSFLLSDEANDNVERGYWPIQDAQIEPRIAGGDPNENGDACGPAHPHSGLGWEGNYDGTFTSPYTFPADVPDPNAIFRDPVTASACTDANDLSCANLMRSTELAPPITGHSSTRPLDRGDQIPFSWSVDNQSDFLTRLAPDGDPGPTFDYGIARFFFDEPAVAGGYLALRNEAERPIIGLGPTQIANSISDFRCYYLGEGAKCNQMAYLPGFESIATSEDSEWGCRRTYVIVLTDGEDNCPGASPCSETANWNAHAIQAWYVRYGNCNSNSLQCITQNTSGESVCPTDPSNLKTELRKIIGLIRQETRTFASAAVPSVQANAGQSVYLTSFRPIDGESVWDGHMDGFLKPVPVNEATKRPTRSPLCSSTQKANCWLWDTSAEIVAQSGNGLGAAENQRRVFYSQATPSSSPNETLSDLRRMFTTTTVADAEEIRHDFWRGLDIFSDVRIPLVTDAFEEIRANTIVTETLATRTKTITPPAPDPAFTVTWAMGEIFHSNPVVAGQPENTGFFALDLESDGTPCAAGNPGYRCFALKHQYRRKMLIAGSNSGMLHVFDAGIFRLNGATVPTDARARYDNGTGREVFAYIPRPVLPTIKELAEGTSHRYGVDLAPVATDVFVDPIHDGTPDPDQRQWRTLLLGGLREGGSSPTAGITGRTGYFALDLTQPDKFDGDVPVPVDGSKKFIPSCIGVGAATGTFAEADTGDPDTSECGPVPFASPRWEWTDSGFSSTDLVFKPLDQDGNGQQDLGETWSTPNVGRLLVCREGGTACTANPSVGNEADDDDLETRYVMVVGGGMDPSKLGEVGNWLYMIDIETGQTLYKRQLQGSAPAEPAAVDTDQDGYLDRIYIGTTAGYMYRADIGPADGLGYALGRVPALAAGAIPFDALVPADTYDTLRVTDPQWEPRILFDTGDREDRAIFYPPSVAFLARLNRYVLAFGTGDREDLWNKSDDVPARFYVFVDDSADRRDALGVWPVPMVESNLATIAVDVATSPATNTDFLLDRLAGQRGWVIQLAAREKLIAPSFALSGILFFTSYNPQIDLTEDSEGDPLCGKKGQSRVFVVQTTNANPLTEQASVASRSFDVGTFVTEPFTEQGQNKNPTPETLTSHADQLTEKDLRVNQALRALFPPGCRFANNRIDVKTVSNDTEVIMIAPVPQCIIEKNWREF